MSCFEKAVTVVLKNEGGFANHSSDPGGATNFGISLRWLKSQGLYGDFDDDGDVDIDDILTLDVEAATRVYRDKWWNANMYDRIINCDVATKLFDTTVNTGASRSHKILQRSLNNLGAKLVIDGVIGPITIKTTNTEDPETLLQAFRLEQKSFYMRLIHKKPSLAVFRNGWLARAQA